MWGWRVLFEGAVHAEYVAPAVVATGGTCVVRHHRFVAVRAFHEANE